MKINGTPYRSVWLDADGHSIRIFDQTKLPWAVEELVLSDEEAVAHAIRSMQVRGAPLIGAVGAYGLAMALRRDPSIENLERMAAMLNETRPTAVNLKWALDRICAAVRNHPPERRADAAYAEASAICDDDVETNRKIGEHGLELLKEIAARKKAEGREGEPVRVLTHCNAGWIATVDYGTALSPIYQAHDAGMDVHVWVDETRPRNQGALTAWELGSHGVPHTFVTDNAGGHLMQHGLVDIVIVGTDRVTRNGDVANKIGTYLKALAAKDNDIPFWVALPHSTLDMSVRDGLAEIPIEERSAAEVTATTGLLPEGGVGAIRVAPESSRAANPAFDVTPARLVTGLITERGRCEASEEGLAALYPERV
ncbi:S-methyl-5-thioribose-1-phosphate isomerase [Roseomonas populi]|uniref:Methylthioribose-1-phosphate isomerase n=1 Tax=Roseomonas populi TaxID=3121582 RepID=A0ABT1X1I4_9PROT|nr:S-methyl-5-thioribose-1-phosphate isomerase [Roseomonas pecuniae]MCR0981258.1 S-methyl-5-thioribose-1-phosphate isomerase [Roseomonas pecuniae]